MTATGAGAPRFFPNRSRGRNFLHDREIAGRFAAAALDSPAVGGEVSAFPRSPEGSAEARDGSPEVPETAALVDIGPGKGRLPAPALVSRRGGAGRGPRRGPLMTATGTGTAGFFPTRSRGPNFLPDREVGTRFAAAAPGPAVCGGRGFSSAPEGPAGMEIGPGKGFLPLPLLAGGVRVRVVEPDTRLAAVFGERGAVPAEGRG